MADTENRVSQIQLPDGSVYVIKDPNVGITSIIEDTLDGQGQVLYEKNVILTVGSLGDADTTEY